MFRKNSGSIEKPTSHLVPSFERKRTVCIKLLLLTNILAHMISYYSYITLIWIWTFRYEIKYSPIKYIETTERGLVVITVNEADGGRYDCYLGGSLLCSYSITVDAHRYEIFIFMSYIMYVYVCLDNE